MSKRMLIDAAHPEETRVVVLNGTRLENYDFESAAKKQLKGNVYLAKITRVEPSLQAAFVEYGGNRHGFLSFNEIHPDYYQIPVADRENLVAEESTEDEENNGEDGDSVEVVGGDEVEEEVERQRRPSYRGYKIQEVIKRRQIVLVQVVKEERGNKGAALTTYLSLAGRYCVLMPNTDRGGGISRKISSLTDRKRLKRILDDLEIPSGIAVIVRTAGAERSKAEIKRDYDYLMKQWDAIRELTMVSTAPTIINEEGNLIKRSIRDLYSKEIDEILVDGDAGYRLAKDFMKTLIPSHAVRVKPFSESNIPLFHRYQVENQIDAIHNPSVQLKSGGYIVMDSTEALVAIDVNSGRATRERNIEATALKTNMEAAEEIARQLRLRDLAGLIVIDFIDMEVSRNIHSVERKLKESLRTDRARIQVGRISHFGLLEMSRQRLRPSLAEVASDICPTCGGAGHVRSIDSTALHVLRAIEEEGIRKRLGRIVLHVPTPVALYILNQKRAALSEIETRYDFTIQVETDDALVPPEFRLDRQRGADDADAATVPAAPSGESESDDAAPRKRRTRRRRPKRREDSVAETVEATTEETEATEANEESAEADGASPSDGEGGEGEGEPKRRRRRGRRGGRRRSRKTEGADTEASESTVQADADSQPDGPATEPTTEPTDTVTGDVTADVEETAVDAKPPSRPRRPRSRASETDESITAEAESTAKTEDESVEEKPKPRRAPRRKPASAAPAAPAEAANSAETAVSNDDEPPQAEPAAPVRHEEAVPETAVEPVPMAASAIEPAAPARREEVVPEAAVEPAPMAASTIESAAPVRREEAVPETAVEPIPMAASAIEPAAEPDKPKRGGWWQKIVR